ncbi:hypothetical protein [Arthrobacter rhombi]|uniref:hypothetical protein n=1 Tax=Arthrobacter rhombi TaxID=71253 RepID=UPI003FD2533C
MNGRLHGARRRAPVPPGYVAAPPLQHQTIQEIVLGGVYGLPLALSASAAEREAEVIEFIDLENGWTS